MFSERLRAKLMKVFTSLFSKSDRPSNARSVGRRPQTAKEPAAFSVVSFSFAPRVSKEKRKAIKIAFITKEK